ncbi:hypothetical protein RHSP_45611 [Rhizobium freirei PRF 81]|uniref:Uncharacterized protein n=1 Tax=Rhizobium freirei PRF 81 TaxID=363754 RepID=N6UBY8_9HYPH|nr:hypothetical protein [Rhizobium freirei]ENN87663.1 hypothetical protein RHSP_45611 [Rhizobium freirei PRF 81]
MKPVVNPSDKVSPARLDARRENGKGRAIARIVGICLAAGLFHLSVPADVASKSLARPAGHYCGKLLSSDRLVDVETSLQVDAKGHLSGTYRFNDDGNTTVGTLSEIGTAPDKTRTLRWFDKYGMGSLTIRFDAGYHRFEGLWGPQDAAPSYPWNGGSCGASIS